MLGVILKELTKISVWETENLLYVLLVCFIPMVRFNLDGDSSAGYRVFTEFPAISGLTTSMARTASGSGSQEAYIV